MRRRAAAAGAVALSIVGALLGGACGASCPTFDDPNEALREATEHPRDDCAARWAEHVCEWSPADHARRKAALVDARTKGVAEIEELYCGCLASTTDPCFVTLKRRASNEFTFVTTGAPGCEHATLPVAASEAVQTPAGCGFTLAVRVAPE